MEFEGQIYDIDLQADDQSAIRRRAISKRHHNAEDPAYDPGSDDGSQEMLGDDTNAVGYPNSLKVTHKYGRVPEASRGVVSPITAMRVTPVSICVQVFYLNERQRPL